MKKITKILLAIPLIPVIILGSAILAQATGPIVNSVTIVDDDSGQSASATSVLAFDPTSRILITKSPDKTDIDVGETVSYTIQIKNVSTDATTLTNLNLTDDYPQTFLHFESITNLVGFTCGSDADKITCNVPSLAPDASAQLTSTFTAIASGTATNTATVDDDSGNTNNITADVNIRDSGNPLLMTNVPDKGNMDIDEEVVFTTTLTNRSSSATLSDMVLTYDYPETLLEFVSATPPVGITCSSDALQIQCNAPTLDPSASATIDFRFKAIASGSATIQSDIIDSLGNTFAITSTVNILNSGDLFYITKEPNRGKVQLGETVFFTVNIKNRSDTQTLNNVTITDDFPEDILNIENVTASPGLDCQNDAVEIRCSIDQIAPGETVTIVSRYMTIDSGQAVNTVDVSDDGTQSGTVSASVVVEDPGSVIRITKAPSKSSLTAGETLDYTVTITNKSDILSFTDIDITDTFPSNLLQINSVTPGTGVTCSNDASSITCSIDSLESDQSRIFTSSFTALAPGLAVNQVNLSDGKGQASSTQANVIILDPGNPFYLKKTPEKDVLETGEEILYTVEVTNTYTAALKNIVLTDDFPEGKLQILGITTQGFDCTNTSKDITCTTGSLDAGATKSITTRYRSIASGTATNTAAVADDSGKSHAVSTNVLIEDPGNIFLVSKSPNKSTIEIGEEVEYEITITNRTQAQVVPDVNIVDDYPEAKLEFISMTSSPGLLCQSDASEIRCNIQNMQPGSMYTMNTRYKAADSGTAPNFLTLSSDITEPGSIGASIQITDPIIREIQLSSNCEARNVLLGQECYFTAMAYYDFASPKDVSNDVDYLNFQSIGTMLGNVFTATKTGTSNISATLDGVTSNPIAIKVTKDIGAGTDPEGNIIAHFSARTGGGSDTVSFDDPILVGGESSGFNVVAENNRLIFSGLGGGGVYHWFLEDRSMGTLRDLASNGQCPDTGFGSTCDNSTSVLFESGNTKGNVLLQVYDDDGNQKNLTIHILPPSIDQIEILDDEGNPISGVIETIKQENIPLTARKIYADGSIDSNAEDELTWEFSHNGGEWTTNSSAGNISRGILEPIETGTFAIRAKADQKIALPGEAYITEKSTEVLSDDITVLVGNAVPFIDSMRTAGNEGFAKGTSDILYVRLRHFDGVQNVGDMELDLIRGKYDSPEDIPATAQHFSIELISKDIIINNGDEQTVLLEIPFTIPLLGDIQQGMHTLRLTTHNNAGVPGQDVVEGVLPIYIGEPKMGDADLNETVDLVDAVLAMRILRGTDSPGVLQTLALDYDGKNGVTISDYITIFRTFLRSFLQ